MNIDITKTKASNEQLSPRVLKSFSFTQGLSLPLGYRLRERYVYDYEFELILFSNGSMLIDENEYPVRKGDIVFRKPGQFTQGIMQYSCCLVCLDMLNNTGKNAADYDFYKEHVYQNYIINEILDSFPPVFNPTNTEKYRFLFDSILEEFINPSLGSELVQKASALNLIYQLYHDVTNPFLNTSIPLSPHYAKIKQVIEYINNNIEKKMMLEELSSISGLSPNHFHKIFSKTMGTTLNSY
ncbi:MAG TPA: AraC family transcriptional regulator, partial [Clostridia bacterium]